MKLLYSSIRPARASYYQSEGEYGNNAIYTEHCVGSFDKVLLRFTRNLVSPISTPRLRLATVK